MPGKARSDKSLIPTSLRYGRAGVKKSSIKNHRSPIVNRKSSTRPLPNKARSDKSLISTSHRYGRAGVKKSSIKNHRSPIVNRQSSTRPYPKRDVRASR